MRTGAENAVEKCVFVRLIMRNGMLIVWDVTSQFFGTDLRILILHPRLTRLLLSGIG